MHDKKLQGAIRALLEEYKKSIDELSSVLEFVSTVELSQIVDKETNDPDCKSIQTVLSHVVQSGYTYIIEIQRWLGQDVKYRGKESKENAIEYQKALKEMFDYSTQFFINNPNVLVSTNKIDQKIRARWGQCYDVEQLMEHAIVHILRHRRQIQNFIIKIREQ